MKLTDAALIQKFILAGHSTFTLRSTVTGARFTYQVRRYRGAPEDSPWFVAVLVGTDNEGDYRYAGAIFPGSAAVHRGKKGMNSQAPSMVALNWYLPRVGDDRVEFFHEGSCAACGRALTVPESIATGFGPICADKNGIDIVKLTNSNNHPNQ